VVGSRHRGGKTARIPGLDGSETFALLVSIVATFGAWLGWFRAARNVTPLASAPNLRVPLCVAPWACLLLLLAILLLWSSFDVRSSPLYLTFYMVMGAAWVGGGMRVVPLFGISARDDVIERGNRAALWSLLGALLGITLCFAGGNIGDGPGWSVVVFCGLLSTGALFALWWLVESLTGISDAVTIDRDPASGLRLGAFLAGSGLVLGRSVAGDWRSAGQTITDFAAQGWPAAAVALMAIGFQRIWPPSAEHPARSEAAALLPALLLLAASIAWVAHLGSWR
jgi:hypothetical protein